MVKVSKAGKARIKRMSAADRKKVESACVLLANTELISSARCAAIQRTVTAAMLRAPYR